MNSERQELVDIDVSEVTDPRDLQLLLMRSLGFPGWYGCNWNAFWDAITGLVTMPQGFRIRGWQRLVERLPEDARIMRECLEELAAMYPKEAPRVEYL